MVQLNGNPEQNCLRTRKATVIVAPSGQLASRRTATGYFGLGAIFFIVIRSFWDFSGDRRALPHPLAPGDRMPRTRESDLQIRRASAGNTTVT